MKTAPVVVLIVLVGVLGWALPARAEMTVMTDAELDAVSAAAAPAFNFFLPFAGQGGLSLMIDPSGSMLRLLLSRFRLFVTVPTGGMPIVRFSFGMNSM